MSAAQTVLFDLISTNPEHLNNLWSCKVGVTRDCEPTSRLGKCLTFLLLYPDQVSGLRVGSISCGRPEKEVVRIRPLWSAARCNHVMGVRKQNKERRGDRELFRSTTRWLHSVTRGCPSTENRARIDQKYNLDAINGSST